MRTNKLHAAVLSVLLGVSLSAPVFAVDQPQDTHHEDHAHADEKSHDDHDHEGTHEEKHDEVAVDKKDTDHEDHGHADEKSHDEHDHEGQHDEEHDETVSHQDDTHHEDHAHADEQSHDEHDHEGQHDEGHDEKPETQAAEDDGHGHGDEEEGVSITKNKQQLANIEVKTLSAKGMSYKVYAPGEIKTNSYTSYAVTALVDSVILKRHTALGEHVQQGEPLVTLFSSQVAEAQAGYLQNLAEWNRVRNLGKSAVGAKRYLSARTEYQESLVTLQGYGMGKDAIKTLKSSKNRLGEYTLTAKIEGAVLKDEFSQGLGVSAGQMLIELADESELWVEARLPANSRMDLPKGAPAIIAVGDDSFKAKVVQEAHTIDPVTRTRIVRLAVNNSLHRLHPGMFADVYFELTTSDSIIALPESALMRGADGDWTVFVQEEAGVFKAVEVELGRSVGESREIIGLKTGQSVVVKGAFFVASEIAKGGFDPHNH